jgi:hypothetical protein
VICAASDGKIEARKETKSACVDLSGIVRR